MSIDALCPAEQMCWGLLHPPPRCLSSHCVLCSVDSEHVCLQALSIHQGRRWWVGPADAPRWYRAAVRKLEPADPTGSPGEGCSEGPASWPQLLGKSAHGLLLKHQEDIPSTAPSTGVQAGAPTSWPVASCIPVLQSPRFPAPRHLRSPLSRPGLQPARKSCLRLCTATLLPPGLVISHVVTLPVCPP